MTGVYNKSTITNLYMAKDFKLNEEQTVLPKRNKATSSGIVGWVIKTGIVKNEGQANLLLVVFILVGLAAIVYLNLQTFGR